MDKSNNSAERQSAVTQVRTFYEKAAENPCNGCPAPCCRMILIPHPTPATFMDLDYILYLLGFPSVQMMLDSEGNWQVLIEEPCGLLDLKTSLCTVHNTPRKPKTCVFLNPYRCWYKRFAAGGPQDFIRINKKAMEAILAHVRFDAEGDITEVPKWEFIRELADGGGSRPDAGDSRPVPKEERSPAVQAVSGSPLAK